MTTPPTTTAQSTLVGELRRIVELERLIRAAQAEQLRRIETARVLAAAVEGVTDASRPIDREFATRSFVAELATTLVVHEATAGRLIADACRLSRDLPCTLDALAEGSIGVPHVRSLLEVASSLPAERVAAFEAAALERAPRETPSAFRRHIRRLRERLHPEPSTARRERAREERRVCVEPAEDGMAWLSLYLEAERGVAIMAHLDAVADARLEAMTDSIRDCRSAVDHDAVVGAASHHRSTRAQLRADVAADLLLGRDPLAGADGPPLGVDLAGYLRIRDGVCRYPGCSRRAAGCDLDHTRDWAAGGATRHDNLAHLCRTHHRLKHHTGWRMSQMPSGDIRWTSPAGREHVTSPDQPFEPVLPIEPPWAAKRPDTAA